MDKDQFRRILQLGLGRAILWARANDAHEFRDVIVDACLHCYAYDGQIEGTRAEYMLDLIAFLPDQDFYCGEVLKSLPRSGDDWDAAQRFHFAACLAFDRNDMAKRAMYESFDPGPRMGEQIGIDFLQMDGINGLLFVSEKIGGLLMVKPRLAEMNSYLFIKWGEQASNEDVERAAYGMIAARDAKEQLAHLRIFARRRFPLDPHVLVALVDVEQERVGFAAVKALARITHLAVRELAFRLVDTQAKQRLDAIDLLARNYQPGDHEIALSWFEAEEDRGTLHSFGTDLINFWKGHPDERTAVLMLRTLYEKGPCSYCRERAVRRLIERNALTEEMRAECVYDSNYDIRELVNT
jgi:hypothetical protein